jgi:hypothetical protein
MGISDFGLWLGFQISDLYCLLPTPTLRFSLTAAGATNWLVKRPDQVMLHLVLTIRLLLLDAYVAVVVAGSYWVDGDTRSERWRAGSPGM